MNMMWSVCYLKLFSFPLWFLFNFDLWINSDETIKKMRKDKQKFVLPWRIVDKGNPVFYLPFDIFEFWLFLEIITLNLDID